MAVHDSGLIYNSFRHDLVRSLDPVLKRAQARFLLGVSHHLGSGSEMVVIASCFADFLHFLHGVYGFNLKLLE
uniref:Uncharacterized protein n=1 Tax=Aeromonas hydrophila TaxID=644 RepID=A0A7S5U9B3_AERHY|nr:Hypothetical protein [Aeromonas hydrophila]